MDVFHSNLYHTGYTTIKLVHTNLLNLFWALKYTDNNSHNSAGALKLPRDDQSSS